ncbi:MAG: hypothetical protein ACLUI3_04355 [Christensenellales bacterium]
MDKAEIPYQTHFYSPDTGIDAISVANALGQTRRQSSKRWSRRARAARFTFS